MAKGKIFDEYLLIEFANRLHDAERKKDKGEAVQWFIDMTGASKGTAYRVRDKILSKEPLINIASAKQTRKKRKSEIELQREKRDMLILSALKNQQGPDRKKVPTRIALRQAELMGYIPEGRYTRSNADRLMAAMKINHRNMKNRHFAHRLKADYPFHIVAVDATPIDHYYLTLDMKIKPYHHAPGDKHLDDILAREQLMKIWVYYMVDMYSKAFLVMPFASRPKLKGSKKSGENADDYYTFLKFCWLPKYNLESPLAGYKPPFIDCPVEGQPTILFCDKGSGIGRSKLITNVCGNLGVRVVTHEAGNPSAKGIVEGRISAFKRTYESMINPALIKDINQLIYFYQMWADEHNKKTGAYTRWREGIKDKPIRRLTEQNFKDAAVTREMRTINNYGCIEIDSRQFFVTPDESYFGQKVQVYRSYEREGNLRYSVLLDRKVIPCLEGIPEHGFDNDFKSHPKSEGARNREEVKELTKQIKKRQIFEDILPEPEDAKNRKVRYLPARAVIKEVHTPLITDRFNSVERALDWLLTQNGLFLEEIPEDYRKTIVTTFEMLLREAGHIDGEIVLKMSNALTRYKKEETGKCQK